MSQIRSPGGLKVGLQLNTSQAAFRFDEIRRLAVLAETVGFDSVWCEDHLLLHDGSDALATWEATTTLSAIAASTHRVSVGFMVVATIFRNPALLAKIAATIDEISAGRLILGIGAGWNKLELATFGYPVDRLVARFDEAFTIVRSLLVGQEVTFAGKYYSVTNGQILPRSPEPSGPELMIGSNGDRMLRITLPHVQGWNAHWSWPDFMNRPSGFRTMSARIDDLCMAVGRKPSEVWRSASVLVQLDGATSAGIYQFPLGISAISGPPRRLAQHFAEFAEAGADHLQLLIDPPTETTVEAVGEALQLMR